MAHTLRDLKKPLGEVATIMVGIPTTSPNQGDTVGCPKVLTVRSIEGGRVKPSALSPAIPGVGLSERYKTRTGDVLISARSTTIDVAIVPPQLDRTYFNATLIAVRCSDLLNPYLLRAYLRHPVGQAELEAISQSGTTQKSITVKALSTIPVPLPPLTEQDRLIKLLEAAEEAYDHGVKAAQKRYAIAREIVVNHMLGKGI